MSWHRRGRSGQRCVDRGVPLVHLAVDPIPPASTPLEDQTLSAAVGVVAPFDDREISQDIAVSVTANLECRGQRTPHQTVRVEGVWTTPH